MIGVIKAWWFLGKIKPQVIFSKGGFGSFPTVLAGWMRGITIIAHESDAVPGLTTRLCFPFVTKQCLGFADSKKHFHKSAEKLIYTGVPLRSVILNGDSEKGLNFLGIIKKTKPLLLIMGGSLGANAINQMIATILPELLSKYTVVHSTGPQKGLVPNHPGDYFPYETLNACLADLYQAADLVISRAGASTVCEVLSLEKPAIFIPLPRSQSRGDQIVNCALIKDLPSIMVLDQDQLTAKRLLSKINTMCQSIKNGYDTHGWSAFSCKHSSETIATLLLSYLQPLTHID